jgi:hypothetical protein
MDMTMSSIRPNRVEVVTSVQRRRRWTPEQKLEIVKQTNEPGSSVSTPLNPLRSVYLLSEFCGSRKVCGSTLITLTVLVLVNPAYQ